MISWCTSYILHQPSSIFFILCCIGVMRQMHVEYTKQRRQRSGDEPALTLPFLHSLFLPPCFCLSLSGGLYFWNQPISFRPDSKYTEDLQGILCLLGYYNTLQGIICGFSGRIPFLFCTAQTNRAVLVILRLMYLFLFGNKHIVWG